MCAPIKSFPSTPTAAAKIITFVTPSPPTVLCLHFNSPVHSALVFFNQISIISCFFLSLFLRRVRNALQYQNVFCSGLQRSEEPEAFLPVLLGGGRGSHRLGGVLLVRCGGQGSGGLWHALGRVAHLPCAYHLAFLQTEVMLYTTKGKRERDDAGKVQWFEFKPVKTDVDYGTA